MPRATRSFTAHARHTRALDVDARSAARITQLAREGTTQPTLGTVLAGLPTRVGGTSTTAQTSERNKRYRATTSGRVARRKANQKRKRGVAFTPAATEYIKALMGDPCAYCGRSADTTIDHIDPVSSGGDSDWANLTAACATCNSSKRTRTLLEFLAKRQ